ncbi:type II toxin-antitoxin system RelE/ParE family toxin [Cytophagales bacterium LB-30]|uniref:Type II toxin-antitoxin system RelE/ParE family toxin n=1 Tax=Shiella aurantiaca TaxID=3058365 RepID=A0ABT8F3B4_9BACT|nr:type II toxin-antitoxin system RelE/ParE family toxin [Shiella aurantiaca]MDN4164912.1 type II toxin-antitoxin system RelE/ParE family toxin [Shiella aurantiaca]
MERIREIHFYKSYFLDFYEEQEEKVKDKIDRVLFVVSVTERIPLKFFKHMEGADGLYEIRITHAGNIYRVFSCFDEGKLVVLFNGFQKKSQKTPHGEIQKALKIKAEYFIEKLKSKGHGGKK